MYEWCYHNISDFLLVLDWRERDRANKPRANRSVVHIGARPGRRRLEISSGKSLSPLVHRSFGHSLVGSRSFCAGHIKFTPDVASARQTFRIRPFPTTCIMHAAVGCCRTTRSSRSLVWEFPLHSSPSFSFFLRVRSVGRNPGSWVTADFQPREESRDTFVCRRWTLSVCFHGRLVNLVSGGFGVEVSADKLVLHRRIQIADSNTL